MPEQIVVIGAGQAAAQAVDTLRRSGYSGAVCVVGNESDLPYQRPHLSKKYLAGAMQRERLLIRQPRYYAEQAIDVRVGKAVVEIERRAQRIRLDDESLLPYDALLIATGSRPRRLAVAGDDLRGVHYVRTLADVDALRAACASALTLVVIGAGYVGLEVAATCRQLGLQVTVIEVTDRVMRRTVGAEVSGFYEAQHAAQGIRVLCNTRVRALLGCDRTRRVRSVLCEDGTEHPADVVVIGVGVAPVDELAAQAGLQCSDGVLVDSRCRTSDPAIYAAGDCTNHPSARFGGRVRLESVDNAVEQATTAARNMLGLDVVHDKVPWFWSDQFDLKLVIVGLSAGYDRVVVRGCAASKNFSACYLRDGELIAVDTVNNPRDQLAARKLIGARMRPNVDKLADQTVPLADCV